MSAETIKEPTELEKRLAMERVAKAIEGCNKSVEAIFWHFNKHKLQPFDMLIVLSGAFKSIQKGLATQDDQTEFQLLFISMIENRYEQPPKIKAN